MLWLPRYVIGRDFGCSIFVFMFVLHGELGKLKEGRAQKCRGLGGGTYDLDVGFVFLGGECPHKCVEASHSALFQFGRLNGRQHVFDSGILERVIHVK